MKKLLFFGLFSSLFLVNCTEDDLPNPYDGVNYGDTPLVIDTVSDSSFVKIHRDILFDSGQGCVSCHDGGMFPPDFRTVESAYNTLVYHPPIRDTARKGTPQEQIFIYRVVPKDTANSVLHERLTSRFGSGTNDIMPLSEIGEGLPQSDIDKISAWIMDGAKDINGSVPNTPNSLPNVRWYKVINATDGDSIAGGSVNSLAHFTMPSNEQVNFHFRVKDDATPKRDMKINRLSLFEKMDVSPTDTEIYSDTATWESVSLAGDVTQTHVLLFNTNILPSGTYFMRYTINDGDNPEDVEFPNNESTEAKKREWSFTIAD